MKYSDVFECKKEFHDNTMLLYTWGYRHNMGCQKTTNLPNFQSLFIMSKKQGFIFFSKRDFTIERKS